LCTTSEDISFDWHVSSFRIFTSTLLSNLQIKLKAVVFLQGYIYSFSQKIKSDKYDDGANHEVVRAK
jgi:hypothetical protein